MKNQPRPLLRPRSVNFCQHFRYLSRKTVPVKTTLGAALCVLGVGGEVGASVNNKYYFHIFIYIKKTIVN
jgi:hypothetical protein